MPDLRLVIWDVDGTLVNSRATILFAMRSAFDVTGVSYPGDAAAMSGVGLSLPVLFARMCPDADDVALGALTKAYKQAYFDRRVALGDQEMTPFFDGMRDVLDALRADDWTLMAVATGKSRRGLDKMISGHGLQSYFQSTQSADEHPSKPNPSMIMSALRDTGVDPARAVIVGDTTFDIDMGRAAGVRTLGVGWGYHPLDALHADATVSAPGALIPTIDELIA